MGQGACPAHPDHRRFGMIAELLRYPFGATCAAERPDGRGDGLMDLVDAGFIRALQRRHKEGVGSECADADGVLGWAHGVPLLRVLLIGGCVPVIVIWRGPRSYPQGVQATGQWRPGTRHATSQPARVSAAGAYPGRRIAAMELPVGADAKLGEHLAQVALNGAGADEQAGTNFRVRQTLSGQPRAGPPGQSAVR